MRLTWRYGEKPETQHDGSACAVSYFSFSSIGQFCILTVNYKDADFVGLDCVVNMVTYTAVFLNGIRLRRGFMLKL